MQLGLTSIACANNLINQPRKGNIKMKTSISLYDFRNAFMQAGRKDQFSYDGLEIIFKYIEDVEDSCGQEFELDVIGICCDYAEDEARGIAESYGIDVSGMSDEDAEATKPCKPYSKCLAACLALPLCGLSSSCCCRFDNLRECQ
jgi:hypothetical protein